MLNHSEIDRACRNFDAHILVVDDDMSFGQLLQEAIIWYGGFKCTFASSAKEALTVMEEQDVDVVIADIRMPDMTGLELATIIHEKYDSAIMVTSGYIANFTREDALTYGASDFFEKHVAPAELISRLNRVVRDRAMSLCELK